jgi:Tfp pilus assembly protein PilX
MIEAKLTNKQSRAQQGFSRRQVLMLAVLATITLVVYGAFASQVLHYRTSGMALVSQQQLASLQVASASEPGRMTLVTAQQQAAASAMSWRPDAVLVGATTSWQLMAGDRLTLDRPAWSFTFYSPSASKLQVVTALQADEGETSVQNSRQVQVNNAPAAVQADWDLGSGELLMIWLAYGGQDFIKQHARVNIHFQLKTGNDGQSVWYLSAVDPVARQSHTVLIDAVSRQVLSF